MHRPIAIRFLFIFALVLAVAAGLVWLVLEGTESALIAAAATLVAALPLPYAASCLLADRAMRRALARAKVKMTEPSTAALLKDMDTLLLARRPLMAGTPHIKELVPEGLSQADLLALAASAEQDAAHPYARVIREAAADRRLRLHRLSAATTVPHAGAEALLMGQALRVGRLDWLEAEGVQTSAELATRADQLAIHGLALVGVALGRRTRGLIAFEEDVSEAAREAIAALRTTGVTTILLTHGGRRYGNALAKALGTDEAKSLGSEEALVRELQLRKAKGSVVAAISADPLPSALAATIDIALTLGGTGAAAKANGAADDEAAAKKSGGLALAALPPLPVLIADLRRVARALRSSQRLALAGFVVLVLPSFGLLHAAGLPFLPPAAAAVGLACFTLLAAVHFQHNAMKV